MSTRIKVNHWLTCDWPTCDMSIVTSYETSEGDNYKNNLPEDWARVNGKDYCPKHWRRVGVSQEVVLGPEKAYQDLGINLENSKD